MLCDRREKLTGSTFRFVLGAVEQSSRAAVELEHYGKNWSVLCWGEIHFLVPLVSSFLSSFSYFVWREESKTWKSERVFWQIFLRGPNIAASRRVMERTSLEITQHLDADGGRAVITLLYGCGRIRKSLWWKTGKNVALHHLFRWTRQENHFFSV